jgi:hypothetical protein
MGRGASLDAPADAARRELCASIRRAPANAEALRRRLT